MGEGTIVVYVATNFSFLLDIRFKMALEGHLLENGLGGYLNNFWDFDSGVKKEETKKNRTAKDLTKLGGRLHMKNEEAREMHDYYRVIILED